MSGEVVFRLTGQEASAVQAFLKVIDAQNKSRANTREHNKELKEQQETYRDMAGSVTNIAMSLAGVSSIMGIIGSSWSQFKDDLATSVNTVKEFQNEFVNLQFIGQHFQDPAFRQKVLGLSAQTGIAAPELARGLYTLESMTGTLSPEQRAEMTPALLALRKTMNVPLDQLVPTFAKMRAIQPNLTGVEQSNISQYLLEKAAVSTPQEMAAYAPLMFSAGLVGQTDTRQSAAFGAFLTAKTGTAAQAAQGMQTIFNKLMLKDPDEAELMNRALAFGAEDPLGGRKNILKRAGVVDEDNAITRVLKLADLNKREKLSAQDLKYLVGERGMRYLPIALEDPEGLRAMIGDFARETGPDKDIIGTKRAGALRIDPTLRMLEAGQRIEAGTAAYRQSPDVVAWENYEKQIEAMRVRGQLTWFGAFMNVQSGHLSRWKDPSAAAAQSALQEVLRTNRLPGDAGQMLGIPTDGPSGAEDIRAAAREIFDASGALKNAAVNRDAHTEGGR